jgi:hypothetical protein
MTKKKKPNRLVRYWESASHAKRTVTVLIMLIAIPVVLTVASYIRIGISNRLAAGKVTHARLAAEKQSDARFNDMMTALQRDGLAKTEIAASKYDVCYITHSDSGWMTVSWYQECYIRYVKGYTTNASRKKVLEFARTHASLFGSSTDDGFMQSSASCKIARQNYRETLRYRPVGASDMMSQDCALPATLADFLSIRMPASGIMVRRAYEHSADNLTTTANSPEIWVEYQRDYYDESLGCGVGLFCGNPRTRAALPDAQGFSMHEVINYTY